MKAAIITIGDEILIGQIVDTNSAWIANALTFAGFVVEEMHSIGDDAQQIKTTLDLVFPKVDVIIMTGGIGPTKDDITKKTLCEYFDTTLVFDESVLENIKQVISNFTTLNELTRSQAYVPENAKIIQNKVGTAPITWFEQNGKVLISLPGVPHEMRQAMEHEILPKLAAKYEPETYLRRIFIVKGYTESALALHLTDFEKNLPLEFGLAYLPSPGLVKLRLFARGMCNASEMEKQESHLRSLLGDLIVEEDDFSVEKIVGKRLLDLNLTLATAESCTGGNIAHVITSIPGSSGYFKGSVIAYSNAIKENVLHVSADSLQQHGAVSEQVALEMAKGVQSVMDVDCVIATTGIAGPDGGTPDKPVGTIWISTGYKDKFVTRKYQLGKFREANIVRATNLALLQLLEILG